MLDENIIQNTSKVLNPIDQYVISHNKFKNKFINDLKKKYNQPDKKTFNEYLRPIYLETLKCLNNIFNKGTTGYNEMINILNRACTLKSYENYIVDSFFASQSKNEYISSNEQGSLKRYELLEEILQEYHIRKEIYSKQEYDNDNENLKKKLISDCMKYIIHRINKRIKYIYNIKARLNSINLKEDIKKRRGTVRKLKFIHHLYDVIDKCCINLIHLTLKELLPLVHDVQVVLQKALSDNSGSLNSVLETTKDMDDLRPESIENASLLYTWFLVMFSMFRIKNAKETDHKRPEQIDLYIEAGNVKANEYGNKKTSMKFLQSRIAKLCDNIDNFKQKYKWERLKRERKIYKLYKEKIQQDIEEYRTHFETGVMSAIPRTLKARSAIRCLFKLMSGTDVDAADPNYLEKIKREREENENDIDKERKGKNKKVLHVEEIDIKETIKNVYNESNDTVYNLYAGVDSMFTNMMAQTNRSIYLQRDVKVAMKNYIKETRKSACLAPFKSAARKKMMYNVQYNKNLSKDLKTKMKKQVNCLHKMSRQLKRFRRTFKRFRKCHPGEDLNKFPPPLEIVYKKWEKRSYRRRLRKGYRKKVELYPKFQFMFVEFPKIKQEKTREQKLEQEFVQPLRVKHEKSTQENEKPDNVEFHRKIYKPKRKGPGVWTSKIYNKKQEEFDNNRRGMRDHLTDFKENTPSECDRACKNKWNIIGDIHNTHKKFVPKNRPSLGKYIMAQLEKHKSYQIKNYLEGRKELQKFCDAHDFKQKHHLECEHYIPEAIFKGDWEEVKRRRVLKNIKELMFRKQLENEMKEKDTSEEEFEEVRDIIQRMKQAKQWCNQHDSNVRQ